MTEQHKICLPTMARRLTLQWLTGFFAALSLSCFVFDARPPLVRGCQGGSETNMLSVGSHSFGRPSEDKEEPSDDLETGSWGVKVEGSSRTLSYTTMVPSAWETRKRLVDWGTHRTEVQGEFVIQPFVKISV
jgi:hypothetical protein